jgi:hypothetical protein
MFRDKPSAYDRLSDALSDIGERLGDLEEQIVERFNPRPSRLERARRAVSRNLPSLYPHQSWAERNLPTFLSGWSLPSWGEARDELADISSAARSRALAARSQLPDARSYLDDVRSHLPDWRLPRHLSFRRGMETQRGIDYLRDRPGATTALVIGGAVVVVGAAWFVTKKVQEHSEEPDYETVRRDGAVEIRDYDAMIVAETVKSGYHEKARAAGFNTLADYIFARNRAGKKINMTTPVLQQLSESDGRTKGWAVRFVMPKKYTKATLPEPSTSDVALKEIPAKRVAAIRFSGNFNATAASKQLMTLYNYLADENLKQKGDPEYAFYNPPWTPGFLKRNEILIEIER